MVVEVRVGVRVAVGMALVFDRRATQDPNQQPLRHRAKSALLPANPLLAAQLRPARVNQLRLPLRLQLRLHLLLLLVLLVLFLLQLLPVLLLLVVVPVPVAGG